MEHITYLVEFADYVTGAADLPSLVDTIKNRGTEGDYLDIYVQQGDTEGTSEAIPLGEKIIGHTQCYYMQEVSLGEVPFPDFQGEERFVKVFLQEIEVDGAGIGLCKKLNELAQQPA